jgi:hypothetical protein
VVDAAWQDRTTLAIVPFDQLEPRLVVLPSTAKTQSRTAHFNPASYPLVATVYAHRTAGRRKGRGADGAPAGAACRQPRPGAAHRADDDGRHRDVPHDGAQMDRLGAAWPAEVVGPELASADITHISNEVPFVEDCVANTDPENFNFCSKPNIWRR